MLILPLYQTLHITHSSFYQLICSTGHVIKVDLIPFDLDFWVFNSLGTCPAVYKD